MINQASVEHSRGVFLIQGVLQENPGAAPQLAAELLYDLANIILFLYVPVPL